MTGHVRDLWTKPGPPDAKGRATRIRTERWGTKGKRWQARTIENGIEKARAFPSKDAAQAYVDRIAVHGPGQPRPRTTFGEFFETWAAAQALRHRTNSVEAVDTAWRYRIKPELGRLPLAELTRDDVQNAVIQWAASYKPSVVHVTYGYVATVCKLAVEDGYMDRTPCRGISLPEKVSDRIVLLTPHQVGTIRDNLPEQYTAAATLDIATGLRIAELAGLTYDRIQHKVVRVDRQITGADGNRPIFGPPKSKRSNRDVPIGDTAWQAITTHMEQYPNNAHDLVFVAPRGGPWVRDRASRAWRNAAAALSLHERAGWHDYRHYHASALIAAGLSPRAVADRLGHANPNITLSVYAHLWGDDTARIVAATDDLLDGI